ncbi:hypothetical protein IAR50_005569 [Cryptococcus sp. DSM 104548]
MPWLESTASTNKKLHHGPSFNAPRPDVGSTYAPLGGRSAPMMSGASLHRQISVSSFVSDLTEGDFSQGYLSSVSDLSDMGPYSPSQSGSSLAQPQHRNRDYYDDGVYTVVHGTPYNHAPIVTTSRSQSNAWPMNADTTGEDFGSGFSESSQQNPTSKKSNGVSKFLSKLATKKVHEPKNRSKSMWGHSRHTDGGSYDVPSVLQNPASNSVEYLSKDTNGNKHSLWKSAKSAASARLSHISLPSRYKPSSWSGSDISSDGAKDKKKSRWQSAKSGATACLKSLHLPKLYRPSSWSGSRASSDDEAADNKSGKLQSLWSGDTFSGSTSPSGSPQSTRALSSPAGDEVGEDWFDESGHLTQLAIDEASQQASRASRPLRPDDFAPEDWYEEDGTLSFEAIVSTSWSINSRPRSAGANN